MRSIRRLVPFLLPLGALLHSPLLARAAEPAPLPAETLRSFTGDGPYWLLSASERQRFAALDAAGQEAFAAEYLSRDPIAETAVNELAEGVKRRRRLVLAELLGFGDDRAQLLFLQGRPTSRETIECGQVYRPMEIWTYGAGASARRLVLYRPGPGRPYRLWMPTDGKRVLYIPEMEYLLDQVRDLRSRLTNRKMERIDLLLCDKAAEVDKVTGVGGLFDFTRDRVTDAQVAALQAPPGDLAAWAREAAATPLSDKAELPLSEVRLGYPALRGQRVVVRLLLVIPAGAPLTPAVESITDPAGEKKEKRELRIAVDGRVEQSGVPFEEFRNRFVLPPPPVTTPEAAAVVPPIVLAVERALRPGEEFQLRLRVRDEVGGAEAYVVRDFRVPAAAQPDSAPPIPEGTVLALVDQLAAERLPGRDSLLLVPPGEDVVFGLWRAEAIVTGERIRKVVFLLDGKPQVTRAAPPWGAELRLPNLPKEQIVRAEGLDEKGAVVASDEVVLNQPQGEPRVALIAPPRGAKVHGDVLARAGVVVPEGHRVEQVEFRVNDTVVATLTRPPWEVKVSVPEGDGVTFLTVAALFSDGTRAEDVRFLNVPNYLEQVEVNLVELYTTVLDGQSRPVEGLDAPDFTILDEGKPQTMSRFEHVVNLPLTLAVTLDLSGSMQASLAEAKHAAVGFLDQVLTPRDRCFAVGFSSRPELLMPPSADAQALAAAFKDLPAMGATALHDAIVFTLQYFRGTSGRRAMVLLSDGDDTASAVPFRDALEFARRSGVVIYTVGLDVGVGSLDIRGKLRSLAEETGGRVFYIQKASELSAVYEQIERELRSQYLLAFTPAETGQAGVFRRVEVKVRGGGLKARTARGYYP